MSKAPHKVTIEVENVFQVPGFKKDLKRLNARQKQDVFEAIRVVMDQPEIGQMKKGDLSGLRVYKFKMTKQLTLLGYYYEQKAITLTLISVGSHENFYRDIKRRV